ncbi:MAG: branched-chain amino acid ABC transporter permease [Solirubrobacterales bacterium]|nr:branched-chain amino acid ABC transporter permease [Solirubrobacterales bacterium]
MNVLQTLIDGVALGAVYALVAVGLALIFGVMRLINFAHGELITAGGYTLALASAWPKAAAIALTVVVCVVLAWAMERIAFRRLRNVAPATTLVATFAVAFTLQAVWLIAFGPQGESADVLSGLNQTAVSGELSIRWITIVMLITGGLLLAGTILLLNRTTIGLQMRAAATDFRAARLLGVRADTVISVAFVIAGVMAAAVAVLLTVQRPLVTPTFGLQVTILALVGVVVGGMDRLWTATLGGFAIGFATSVLGEALPSDQRVFLPSAVFLLVIVVLLLRPGGLFAPRGAGGVERV